MKVELNLEELRLIVDALDDKHNSYAYSGAEVLPELNAVNRLYNRLSDLEEQQIENSPAIGLIDRQVEIYEATLRQKVEVKIQASIREYKALLHAENDRTPGPPRDLVRGPVKNVGQTKTPTISRWLKRSNDLPGKWAWATGCFDAALQVKTYEQRLQERLGAKYPTPTPAEARSLELNREELRLILDALDDKQQFQFLTKSPSYTGQLCTDRVLLDGTGRARLS